MFQGDAPASVDHHLFADGKVIAIMNALVNDMLAHLGAQNWSEARITP